MTKKAKRRAVPRKKTAAARVRRTSASVRRTSAKSPVKRAPRKAQPVAAVRARAKKAPPKQTRPKAAASSAPGLERPRRTLDDTVAGPPSSLDMDRRGSSVRTGRAEIAESLREHRGMSPDITGGDVDVDVEDAYFTGDEAPGGDNPTPDQDIVDDIGRALGVEYQDNEELKAADKVAERDRKRWELDPASSEDYKERK
jgi:hypothetical protein